MPTTRQLPECPNIHVLEDDLGQQIFFEFLVGEAWPQARITTAVRLSEAIDGLAADPAPVDVVFTDLNVPDGRGVEVPRALRGVVAATTRVIALSVGLDAAGISAVLEAGADGFLSKDALTPEALRAAVAGTSDAVEA